MPGRLLGLGVAILAAAGLPLLQRDLVLRDPGLVLRCQVALDADDGHGLGGHLPHRGLEHQERLTVEIAENIAKELNPRGVAVVVEAIHLCMMMRGVEQQNSFAITSSLRGVFQSDSKTRSEFMELIRHQRQSFA